jgi:hypothetical protein
LFLFRARLNSDREKDERRRYDERHWTEKKLEEMADRDWRIFKEDYNITTRGGNIPHPLRYWEEAGLEKGIIDVIKLAGYKVIQIFKTIFLITSDFFFYRNQHLFNDKLYQLVYKIEMLLVLQKLVLVKQQVKKFLIYK